MEDQNITQTNQNLVQFFSPEIGQILANKLEPLTEGGRRISAHDFCRAAGLLAEIPEKELKNGRKSKSRDEDPHWRERSANNMTETMVRFAISLGLVPGYVGSRGPDGGIGRVGATVNRQDNSIPADFVQKALSALNENLPANDFKTGMTRAQVTKAMGCPGSREESMLSRAFKDGLLPGFSLAQGRTGFRRDASARPVEKAVETQAVETQAVETQAVATETAAEAAAEETTEATVTNEVKPNPNNKKGKKRG